LLFYLCQPAYHVQEYPEEYKFVFLDLQELSGAKTEDFFTTILARLRKSGIRSISFDESSDANLAGFRKILGQITDANLKLVLCLDEFEMLSQNPNYSADFFTYLRGLCSNYNFALVTSSRRSLFDLCHQRDLQTSQLWNIFVELPLGLMKSDEIQTMVRKYFERSNLSLAQEHTNQTLALTGNHPFFVQIAFYFLFEACSQKRELDFTIIHDAFMNESKRHYIYAWDLLDEPAQQILSNLEKHQAAVSSTLFQVLRRDALLQGSADHPEFTSTGFREFVRAQIGKDVSPLPDRNTPATAETILPPDTSQKAQVETCRIFISYRRSDSADITGRIYDRLIGRFGKEPIFKDVDSIPLGLDFVEYLDMKVGECDVLLAIIGGNWLDAKDENGNNRLDNPADFVRIEIQAALDRNIPVIPLLVRDTRMPREEDLPLKLRKLVYRNGTPIRSDPDFHRDMDSLLGALEKLVR